MAFSLYDEDGYVGPVASIEGYGELLEIVQWARNYPALQAFCAKGMSTRPRAVLADVEKMLVTVKALDKETKDTLVNLRNMLRKETKKEVIIVSG